jgi:hypothetical protein
VILLELNINLPYHTDTASPWYAIRTSRRGRSHPWNRYVSCANVDLVLKPEPDIVLPKQSFAEEHSTVLSSLSNCTNLNNLALTRHGNLTNGLIDSLCTYCSHLQYLAINGDSRHLYDPKALLKFTSLSGIKLIAPGAGVFEILGEWLHNLAGSLISLDIVEPVSVSTNILVG